MQHMIDRVHRWLDRYERAGLVGLFLLFVLLFGGFAILKFYRFGYDVLDLAIYDQVMKFMLRGEWFHLTIHPGSYLGDHFELFLVALLPVYALAPHPITLLLLQTIGVGLTIFPLARLVRDLRSGGLTLLIAFWFLFNPITQHLTLFEFHVLPFALPLIFWALACYQEKKWKTFFLLVFISLTIREDVALFWMFFSVYSFAHRRSWRWTLTALLPSALWFIAALKLISVFNPDQTYKFFVYYRELGSSVSDVLANLILHPDRWFGQLVRVQNIAYVFMVIIFSFGLPLFALPALLPLIPILAQIFLASFGGGEVTLFSHYSTLVLPALFFSSILAIRHFADPNASPPALFPRLANRLHRLHRTIPALLPILIATIMIYSILTLAPLPAMITQLISSPRHDRSDQLQTALQALPASGSGLGSFALLPFLTDRPELYSLHYAWKGTRQFSEQPFPFPDTLDFAVLDTNDLLALSLQHDDNSEAAATTTAEHDVRLQEFLKNRGLTPSLVLHDQVVWTRDPLHPQTLFTTSPRVPNPNTQILQEYFFLPPSNITLEPTAAGQLIVSFDLTLGALRPLSRNDQVQWTWKDLGTGEQLQEIMPLAYGLYPTSRWKVDETISTSFRLLVPKRFANSNAVELSAQLQSIQGHVGLNRVRASELVFDQIAPRERTLVIGTVHPLDAATL